MPFNTFTFGTVLGTASASITVAPGVLFHALLHAHANTIQPGDITALLYICDAQDPSEAPYANLDTGNLTLANPLRWHGRFPIEIPSSLRFRITGFLTGNYTLSYGRLTITNPHEIGTYESSLRK